MRYYYKTQDESGWLSLKSPDFDNNSNYVKITEQEFNEHLQELEESRKQA